VFGLLRGNRFGLKIEFFHKGRCWKKSSGWFWFNIFWNVWWEGSILFSDHEKLSPT